MITLKDLAKKLDVSVSTVSKALNDSPEISQGTVVRIKALANYYNYKPNKTAVSLRNNQTKTIGVIVPNILNRFFAKVLFGIQQEALNYGYNIIHCNSNESNHLEKESLKLLSYGSVDGFILAISEESQLLADYSHFENIKEQKIPLVMFDRVLDNMNCDKVIIDDINAVKKAVQLFIQKNRKNIGFISSISELNVGKLRENGFKEAIQKAFGRIDDNLILNIHKDDDIQEQLRSFLLRNKHIDGIIAADNTLGTIAINVAASLGLKIPEDISVVGFADATISNFSVPKLSLINQNAKEIGKCAARLLIGRLTNTLESEDMITEIIETTFISNGSD